MIKEGDNKSHSYFVVEPLANAIVESLRAIGYNLETAISDIIDNSISAGAKTIAVDFRWAGEDSYIRIEDNGRGMQEAELIEAMRLGSHNPLEARHKKDLGRFGLGLKTATFSQCRRLTVSTKIENGGMQVKCWDLDFIQSMKQWALINHVYDQDSDRNLGSLGSAAGTIVMWENLDKLIGSRLTLKSHDNFLKKVERTEKYLGMVFHRFLGGPNAVSIVLNNRAIKAWDPFMVDELSTQEFPEERFSDGKGVISVKSYILPHHSKLSNTRYELGEGMRGWTEQQGFYIYRNRRLLVAGDWMGMFRKEESCKLARISVDISNEMDVAWDIDVKKASARPPDFVLDDLKRIGTKAREHSSRVYYHRGSVLVKKVAEEVIPLWNQVQHHGGSAVRVNRQHPLVQSLVAKGKDIKQEVEALLSILETNLPIGLFGYLQPVAASNVATGEVSQERKEEIRHVMKEVVLALQITGLGVDEIRYQLSKMEPFNQYPELISIML